MACGGARKRSSDLMYDLRAYNDGIRWRNFPKAAVRIMPEKREEFMDSHEEVEDELRVDDFEVMRMKIKGEDQSYADVQVKWTWHLDSKGVVQETTSRQRWQRFGRRWLLIKETHVKGPEMPTIAPHEPGDDEEDEAGDEGGDSELDEGKKSEDEGEEKGPDSDSEEDEL